MRAARRRQVREESDAFLERLKALQKGVLDMVEPYPLLSAWTEETRGSSRKKESGKRIEVQPNHEPTGLPCKVADRMERTPPIKLGMFTQNPNDDLLTKNGQRLFLMKDTGDTELQSQLSPWDN